MKTWKDAVCAMIGLLILAGGAAYAILNPGSGGPDWHQAGNKYSIQPHCSVAAQIDGIPCTWDIGSKPVNVP
jgi:hypothetical protein